MAAKALVLQGGGIRGVYTAGVLDVLLDEGISFDAVYGTSAGSLNGMDFVSQDRGRTYQIYMKYMRSTRFVSITNWLFKGSLFDFDYLFNQVAKKIPFHEEKFQKSQTEFTAVATCLEEGEAAYFSKSSCSDIYAAVAASSSLPRVTPKPVEIGGKHFLDGGPTDPIPYEKAVSDGYSKIVVVLTRPLGFRKREDGKPTKGTRKVKKMYRDYPAFWKAYADWDAVYNQEMDVVEASGKEGKCLLIAPSRPIDLSLTKRGKKRLNKVYHLGIEDAKTILPALRGYLSSGK